MMIRVKSTSAGNDVMVQISIGRKGKSASYDLNDRGTLCMTADEWVLFKRTLERGAVRPVIVVVEDAEEKETAGASAPSGAEKSPF